jgi:thioredoxin 1
MKLFFAPILFLLLACSPTQKKEPVLAPREFQKQLAATPNAVLVDVRRPEELAGGKIEGARNIVFGSDRFEQDILTLEKQPIFVYCAGGVRSAKAAALLRKNGYEVVELEGGFNEWVASGLPVAKR